MGMFDHVTVEEGVELPYFPESLDQSELGWQTKSFRSTMTTYKITEDGRLKRKEQSYRDKTAEEKQAEAEKWGFDSWEEYVAAYDNMDEDNFMYPDEIDYDPDEEGYEDMPPTFFPSETTLDETWWADQNHHGSMEFHEMLRRNPTEYKTEIGPDGEEIERPDEYELEVFLSYEARFTKGDLDEIILLGRRGATNSDHREEVIAELQEWNASHASGLDGDEE